MISGENSKPLDKDDAYKRAMHAEQLKKQAKINAIKVAKKKWYITKVKTWTKITLITGFTLLVLLFPSKSGIVIGQWINHFFGNIVKESIK